MGLFGLIFTSIGLGCKAADDISANSNRKICLNILNEIEGANIYIFYARL